MAGVVLGTWKGQLHICMLPIVGASLFLHILWFVAMDTCIYHTSMHVLPALHYDSTTAVPYVSTYLKKSILLSVVTVSGMYTLGYSS